MPNIDLRGARIAYAEAGAGETVLLLHATASSGSQWRALVELLRPCAHVLAPDLYGYGETDPWPGHGLISLADEAALTNAVLPAGEGAFHLVGHSYGGAVALRLAMEQPERLRSLVLIEPVAFHLLWDDSSNPGNRRLLDEVTDIAAGMSRGVASGDYRRAMAHFIDYWNGEGAWQHAKPELQAELARRIPKVVLDFWATMTEATPRAAYRAITAPTLLLRGSRSPEPTRRVAELVAENLPNCRLQTIAGAGHMLPITHKESVNAAIAAHLLRAAASRHRPAAA